ncbi:uncharacterized protein LOC121727487 [Aricia agestis]|uniref:uncharacterized protein LOC121727487 n=1 Tax=Aricia agestis TaxID=91739 RepID=UPI001C20C312|nr:uncharacterized protein LOC121727487 [Aricia agestis]
MDRLNQLKGESGGSGDLTLDTSSPPSESFMTANESSSKYFSLSEVDSTFDVSPSKDSAISTTANSEQTLTDSELIPNLSPIPKKVDSFQIGKQIEAANILSGGVNIFDDNDNSYDGNELVIDDNVPVEESCKTDEDHTFEKSIDSVENTTNVAEAIPSIDTEVVLQIDGKNVNAIAIGNGLYLYRKGVEELAAIQMIDDNQQQPSFKFLKVRDNAEGNLEVYEEIEVEVPNKVPVKEGKAAEKRSNVPIKDACSQVKNAANEKLIVNRSQKVDSSVSKSTSNINTDVQSELKSEVNLNGKKVKLNESRKSPLISTFTPMTYHSTPNKEGIPLTKTMVDQQLHPSRQSDNIKKTIEVHTDSCKRESPIKEKDCETIKLKELLVSDLDKTELQLEILNSSNVATEAKDAGKTDNIENTKILEIENIMDVNEKLLPVTKISIAKPDDEHKNVLEDVESNSKDKILNINRSGEENNINSNEEQCKSINNHTMKVDKKVTSIADFKSKSNEITKPEIESQPSSTEGVKSPLLDDIKLKLETTKSTLEPIKSLLKQEELKEEIIKEDKLVVAKSVDNIEKMQMLSNTVQKTDKFESDKILEVSSIESDKNMDIESSSKILLKANETLQLSENSIQKNIVPPKKETKSHNSSDCNEPNADRISNTEVLTSKILVIPNDSHTNKSTNNKDPSEMKLSTKDVKPTEIISQTSTGQKADPRKDDCNIDDSDLHDISKKTYDIGKDNKSTKITAQAANKNELIKGVKNVPETEITIEKSKDKNDTELSRVNFGETMIKPQSNLEVGKETSTSSNEIPQSQLKTKLPINVTKNKPAGTRPNNYSAVPFGKWTEANRQEFLNKIKETKIPGNISNTKQLKQPNDLNRRDVLKKIDTQRQAHLLTAKNQESAAYAKAGVRGDSSAAFVNKSISTLKSTDEQKNITTEPEPTKNKPLTGTITFEETYIEKNESMNTTNPNKTTTKRKEINNQDLIDKTIEGIISRAVSTKPHDEWKQTIKMDAAETLKHHNSIESLDDMERKMNELHGIPFVERPVHELPQVQRENKCEKPKDFRSNTPHLSLQNNKDNISENISDEEIIAHQPVTGDMAGQNPKIYQSSYDKCPTDKTIINEDSKKDTVITEKDFDKFARRNSITYENRLTVEFDGRESHNVIQTLVEKEVPSKKMNRNEMMLAESKAKSTNKHLMMRHNINSSKSALLAKATNEEDSYNKNYQSQSKVQLAYQSALTAKRQLECPITILEDKPVKVVFLESGSDFASTTLNVQGKELSPSKKISLDSDSQSASESLDSDVLDSPYETKSQDETRSKSKHQRKQVLTPVDIPELELIEPSDLGVSESPKKRRRVDETKEKSKAIAPKKSYLLNRAPADDKTMAENTEIISNEGVSDSKPFVVRSDAISAIDNLVKAAELIETQSEKKISTINLPESDIASINTPTKRGRGRPRKYPLSESSQPINKTPTPKKPRLVDPKLSKKVIESDDSDDSNEEFIKENWTMGKINENIVCPICNKLFRSENVVFKHVKHCTGPSPNRSESSRSFRKFSQSEGKSDDSDSNISDSEDDKPIKPKATKSVLSKKEDVIVIEDTPQKKISEEVKLRETNKPIKVLPKSDNLVCDFCGKTFRQLSYLVNHKQLHKKEENKIEKNDTHVNKSIFSCEVCKKEFRKLHHLVQHRIIHNPSTMSSRLSRKNSNEKNEANSVTDLKKIKHDEDQSAGFRCEPCDKSFRKLHHLVEHRETHDGINKRVSSNNDPPSNETIKTSSNYVCTFCNKSFKKLQQLTEHKEQHCDSCSEKSDDVKSVKSSLSTKDIIHECSLCYMVFPNEHSLNKHTIICLRKKKQSAAKQSKLLEQKEKNGQDILADEDKFPEIDVHNQSYKDCEAETNRKEDNLNKPIEETGTPIIELSDEKQIDEIKEDVENIKTDKVQVMSYKMENASLKRSIKEEEKSEKPNESNGKKHSKIRKIEVITIPDTPTPKKKNNNIETKKPKPTTEAPPEVINDKISTDVSDDDDVRYMLNPNIKEDVLEEKVFMKVRAKKRSSLQFERPNSKDLVKRRISLQNPPKVQRSKTKLTENKGTKPKSDKTSDIKVKTEQTDSDDSDVKYSFPQKILQSTGKDKTKTIKKEVTVSKRESITGIARRKSLAKHKIPVLSQKIKKRTTEVEHRCDCGQLFSSAALLSRHTTLAHTPPRVRRPRDPPPPPPDKPQTKGPAQPPAEKRKTLAEQSKVGVQQKKSAASSNVPTTKTRKSIVDNKSSGKVVKSESNSKTLRSAAHKGVPVPDKMKKFMDKYK